MTGDPQAPDRNDQASTRVDALHPFQTHGEPEGEVEQAHTYGMLRISEASLQLVIESIRDFAIITMDLAGVIASWNQGAEIMFGFRPDEATGQSIAIIFTPEDRAANAHILEMETARTQGRAIDERWHMRKDGTRFYVSGVLTSLENNGSLIGYVKVARDLTERNRAEESLRQLNETLESRVAERTEQVRNLVTELTLSEQDERRRVSQLLHDDLQQRLYSMNFQLTAARFALDDGDHENVRLLLVEAEEALTNMVEVTRSLSVDLSPPILHQEGFFEALHWLALQMKQQHGLLVTIDVAETTPVPDEDLRVTLFQTVRELLFNVVKHAGVHSATIAITLVDGVVRIQVGDSGRGFETNAQRTPSSQGLLRIRQRLQLLGGNLDVESAPGQGTRITLYSPLRRESAP